MAQRNGIIPSSIPFEQRYRPPDRKRRRRERLTVVDRLVCAICGSLLGMFLWTVGYLILLSGMMKAAARQPTAGGVIDPFGWLPSFAWGGFAAVAFAVLGAIAGAELMMDAFVMVLRVEGKVAKHVNRS